MSKAVRRIEHRHPKLVSKRLASWLDEVVFELKNGNVKLSRRNIAVLSESPCTKAASLLHKACQRSGIESITDLNRIGLDSLLRCAGVGERAAWLAALILEDHGFDVDRWISHKPRQTGTRREHIRLVHSRVRKQKHG